MRISVKSIILVFLMLALSLSVATNSLNGEVETPTFEEIVEPLNVILPIADLNVPGHQEGSIFTDTTLSSGWRHTCAILDNGSASCWGENGQGRLGHGAGNHENTPTQTSGFGDERTAVSVSSGKEHTCAILDNGAVSCWGGWGTSGELGQESTGHPHFSTLTLSLGTNRTAVALSSGDSFTCGILDNGSVNCWGRGNIGQIGIGTTYNGNHPTQTSSLGIGRTAVAISSGYSHTCVILDDGSVSCWGANSHGQLGDGTITDRYTPTQTSSFGTERTAVGISSGNRHTCAILDDGTVSCWGRNAGTIGDGTTTDRYTPTQTSGLGTGRTAVAISSGDYHTCALLDDGSVSCWGENGWGQFGDGTTTHSYTPTQTSSFGPERIAVAISSGSYHTCAILDDGSISCWGMGSSGQIGDGTNVQRNVPTPTLNLGTATNPRTAALSERDFDTNGILNIFEPTPPPMLDCTPGQYGRYHICFDAPAGKFVPSSSAVYATDCPIGTYQATTGQTSCNDSSAGYYVAKTGQTSQSACLLGTFQPLTGQSSCDKAWSGHYVPATAQLTQTPCPAGTYQTAAASASCKLADSGHYVNSLLGDAQYSQTACLAGYYNPNIGSTSSSDCRNAGGGHYVSSTGSSNQTACTPGTYNPSIASTSSSACLPSDVGHYVSVSGSPNQTACPLKTSTINISSKSIEDCILDTDSDSIPNTIDLDDDGDNYSDVDEIECGSNDTDANSLPNDLDQDFLCDEVDSDIDGDGYEIDSFPYDVNEWNDTDDDGFGDNSDACPNNFGTSIQDRNGCIDTDSDGISDLNDPYPFDASKGGIEDDTSDGSVEGKSSSADSVKLVLVTISVTLLVIISVVGVIFIRKRNSDEDEDEDEEDDEEESEYSDEPNYSLRGEINDDGWEVLEYPSGSGRWWWKDQENHCWQSWD